LQTAYRLHERAIELFVKRVLTRMTMPRSLDHRMASELMVEVVREILTNQKPASKPGSRIAKTKPSPEGLRPPAE